MRFRRMAVVAVVGASLLGVSAPAFAHDQLTSTNPANGQLLEAAPAAITLTFSENVLDIGNAVQVVDAAGTNWADGTLTVADGTVTAPLTSGMPNGVYTVNWRVVSADGHPVSAAFVFGVGSGAALTDELAVAAAAVAPPADDDASGATDTPLVTAQARTADDPAQTLTLTGIGAIIAIALFIGGFAAIRRGRAAAHKTTEGSDS